MEQKAWWFTYSPVTAAILQQPSLVPMPLSFEPDELPMHQAGKNTPTKPHTFIYTIFNLGSLY